MKSGFTLIELVVAIGIIVTMTAFGIPAFRRFGDQQQLVQAAQALLSTIHEAQGLSLAPRGGDNNYFVRLLLPNRYVLGATLSTGPEQELRQVNLPQRVTIQSIAPAGLNSWTFNVNDQGRLASRVEQRVTLSHATGIPSKTIVGNPLTGLIEVR